MVRILVRLCKAVDQIVIENEQLSVEGSKNSAVSREDPF